MSTLDLYRLSLSAQERVLNDMQLWGAPQRGWTNGLRVDTVDV